MSSVKDVKLPLTKNSMVVPGIRPAEDLILFREMLNCADPGTERSNLLVLTRIMVRILESHPLTRFRPVLSLERRRHSLWQAAILEASPEEAAAFGDFDDETVLLAANYARWVLGLPQQVSVYPLVFVSDEDVIPDNEEGSA